MTKAADAVPAAFVHVSPVARYWTQTQWPW